MKENIKPSIISELEKWRKESKIYEVKFKGSISIKTIESKEELEKRFIDCLEKIENDYFITGAKFYKDGKFYEIKEKNKRKYDNWRILISKTAKRIKFKDALKYEKR